MRSSETSDGRQSLAPNGRPAHLNFEDFFKGSHATDAKGQPLRLYHGTWKDFDTFHNPYAGKCWEMFSDSPEYSAQFAQGDGGRIIPVYLAIVAPLDLRGLPAERGDARSRLLSLLSKRGVSTSELRNSLPHERDLYQIVNMAGHHTCLAECVLAAGYDSLIMPELLDGRPVTTYVALNNKLIKSAIGNSGLFDRNSSSLVDGHLTASLERQLRLGILAREALKSQLDRSLCMST